MRMKELQLTSGFRVKCLGDTGAHILETMDFERMMETELENRVT